MKGWGCLQVSNSNDQMTQYQLQHFRCPISAVSALTFRTENSEPARADGTAVKRGSRSVPKVASFKPMNVSSSALHVTSIC